MKIIKEFFPRFIDTIPTITSTVVEELSDLSLGTPNKIAAVTDETLLNIKGVGKAKLKIIRDYCTGIEVNRDAPRLDKVTR